MSKQLILIILPLFIISIIGLNSGECQLADSPWPKFRHDLKNTGQSPYFGPQKADLAWHFDAKAAIVSSPAIAEDGTIYLGAGDNVDGLYAINPDGTQKWFVKMEGAVVSSPAIDTSGTIYVASWNRKVYAINPDGSVKSGWHFTADGTIKSSPSIGPDGTIYIGGMYHFYALNPDGTTKFESPKLDHYITYSSPVIDSFGRVYIGCWDGNIYVYNPEDNSWKKFYSSGGNIESSPAIGPGGTIYIGVAGNKRGLHAINPDGTLKKIFNTNGNVFSSPAIAVDSTIYVGSRDSNLYAFKLDGSKKWNYPTGGWVDSSPAIGADGKIYFGSDDKYIYCLKPDGTLKWRYATGGAVKSSPAIGNDGRLFVGSDDGKLYTFWGCNRGPKHDPTSDSLNLDNDADFWGIYCEGTPEWILENVSGPSQNGTALHCGIMGGDMPYSNVHCYRNFPAQADKDSFYLSLYFHFDKTTYNDNNSIIQALEFTMNKWQDEKRYEWALQWQNVADSLSNAKGETLPQWRYWDPNKPERERWVSLRIEDRLEGEKWHFLEMIGKIDTTDSSVHYLEFTINANHCKIDTIKVKPASAPGVSDHLAVAFQLDGTKQMSPYNVYIDLTKITAVHLPSQLNISNIILQYTLDQNYPNPFNPSTTINFALPKESEVLLQIFNIRGELIRILEERKLPRGNHSIMWNGQDSQGNPCPSGIYFCQLRAGDFSAVKKLTMLK